MIDKYNLKICSSDCSECNEFRDGSSPKIQSISSGYHSTNKEPLSKEPLQTKKQLHTRKKSHTSKEHFDSKHQKLENNYIEQSQTNTSGYASFTSEDENAEIRNDESEASSLSTEASQLGSIGHLTDILSEGLKKRNHRRQRKQIEIGNRASGLNKIDEEIDRKEPNRNKMQITEFFNMTGVKRHRKRPSFLEKRKNNPKNNNNPGNLNKIKCVTKMYETKKYEERRKELKRRQLEAKIKESEDRTAEIAQLIKKYTSSITEILPPQYHDYLSQEHSLAQVSVEATISTALKQKMVEPTNAKSAEDRLLQNPLWFMAHLYYAVMNHYE